MGEPPVIIHFIFGCSMKSPSKLNHPMGSLRRFAPLRTAHLRFHHKRIRRSHLCKLS